MAAISEEIKVYIVTALACFDGQKQVIADVKERFGVVVTHQQVSAYEPSTINGKRLSKQYKELFATTRENFLKNVDNIPIANASYRLRTLDRLARRALDSGNSKMVAALMEQAAKETGGAFTNRRELGGAVGGVPIPAPPLGSTTVEDAYKAMLGHK